MTTPKICFVAPASDAASEHTHQFERDLRLMARRGKDLSRIKAVMAALIDEQPLASQYRDHSLAGEYQGRRDCRIEPDWLLIYKLTEDEIVFECTGAHADLFE